MTPPMHGSLHNLQGQCTQGIIIAEPASFFLLHNNLIDSLEKSTGVFHEGDAIHWKANFQRSRNALIFKLQNVSPVLWKSEYCVGMNNFHIFSLFGSVGFIYICLNNLR